MWHATCTQWNQGDSRLLVVGNQTTNFTPDLSFGHNLCVKYPNGSCKPILHIYIPRNFQWYKEFLNPMSFDPWNRPLKIQKSIGIPISKVGVHLGVVGVHSFTLSYTPRNMKCDSRAHSWPTPLQAFALITSPRLSCDNYIQTQQNFHINQQRQIRFGKRYCGCI